MPDHAEPRSSRPAERPPQVPARVPWLGHSLQFGRDPVGLVKSCRERYGDVFSLKFPSGRRTLLLDPRDYPAYFKDKRLQFAVVGNEVGERVFGYEPVRVEGFDLDSFTHHCGHLLKGKHLPPLDERIQLLLSERLAAHGTTPQRLQLMEWIQQHIFAAGTDALCGDGFYSRQAFDDYATVDRFFPLLLAGVPAWALRSYTRARARFARATRKGRSGRSTLLETRDEQLARIGLPPDQIDLHNMVWVWASQVNTLNSTFWTLVFLLRHAPAREAIEREVREVCGSAPLQGTTFSEAQLRDLAHLDSAITESLRLTAGPMVTRRVMEPLELSTASGRVFAFEAGDSIDLFPYLTHLDPEIYEEPETFRHDRFLADPKPPQFFKHGQKLAFPLLPFGSGVSMCPGRFLARNEIKIIVALLLSHFEIELSTEQIPPIDFSRMGLGMLPPKHDVAFSLRRR